MTFRIVPLDDKHNRKTFSCGEEALDRYFREQVTQDIRRKVTTCFVVLEQGDAIAGYYTLASSGICLDELPSNIAKRLPRYPLIPALRIGRLAVDKNFQGQGIGGIILVDVMHRALRLRVEAGIFALVVDAKNDAAVSFYEHHGFMRFESLPQSLFLPLSTVEKALS